MDKNGGKRKLKKRRIPWAVWARSKIAIESWGDHAEFLFDMGYTTRTVAPILGVRKVGLDNWKRTNYHGQYKADHHQADKQPFLVCNRFTFKNRPDPKTMGDRLRFQERLDAIRGIMDRMLSKKEKRILWNCLSSQTYTAIGDEEGCTRERIRQIVKLSIGKLRRRITIEHPEWEVRDTHPIVWLSIP